MITPDDPAWVVRQYMTGLARRYLPTLVFFAALGLVIGLVPSVSSNTAAGTGFAGQTLQTSGSGGGSLSPNGTTANGQGISGSPISGGGSPSVNGKSSGGSTGGPSGGGVPGAGTTVPVGVASPGSPGLTVGGVNCGPGVRQVPWSAYSPYCIPAWQGSNGGATAPGVTATTITLVYREASTGESGLVSSLTGGSLPADSAVISDLQTYIGLLNRTFELYGRKVILKPYKGQGDWVLEGSGQDLQGAQADAVTARQMGAFGDVSTLAYVTPPYAQALVQQHVITFNISANTQPTFDQWAPYAYSYLLTADKLAAFNANLVCKRLNGWPAIYSGDYKTTTRKLGLIVENTPDLMYGGDRTVALMSSECGAKFALRANVDTTQGEQESISIIAQMKAAGVTTVVCECGGDMMEYAPAQADSQNYHPEWVVYNGGDSFNRLPQQDQWSRHAISMDDYVYQQGVPQSQSEAYRAFKLANPHGQPAEVTYSSAYFGLLQVFDALQQAGPDLTPYTFEHGMFSLPTSGLGSDGIWTFGQGIFTPLSDSPVTMWNTNTPSPGDGKAGTWVACDSQRWYSLTDPSSWGVPEQLRC